MPVQLKTSHRDEFLALLKSYSDPLIMLTIPRILIDFTQDIHIALMLMQLIFWSDRAKRKDGFVYKSSVEWQQELTVTDHTVRQFNKLPYIETKIKRANGSPTTHYRVRYDLLHKMIREFLELNKSNPEPRSVEINTTPFQNCPIHSLNTTNPPVAHNETLTKITTKITTERVNAPVGALQVPQKNTQIQKSDPKKMTPEEKQLKMQQKADLTRMMEAIAQVCNYCLKITDIASACRKLAKTLLAEGYTPQDVLNFETYWKQCDWRWKKDRQLPTPRNIKENIHHSKKWFKPEQTQEELRALALQELEEYRKSREAHSVQEQFKMNLSDPRSF